MSTFSCCYGALALECSASLVQTYLPRTLAAELADHVATDLARLLTGVEALDLAVAAAAFDPSELLRPGWPVHTALADLVRRAPAADHPRVLGFGSHDGVMPAQLSPDPALREGPLRLLPFVLHGETGPVAAMQDLIEAVLLEKGMAQAALAFFVQKSFNVPLEHVRFLSLNDLAAMTAMQYEHVGLAPLWPLIEAALFHPGQDVWLDAPPEPLLRWTGHEVRMAEMDQATWTAQGFAPSGIDTDRMARAFARFQMRQAQYRAVLGCHAIPLQVDAVPAGQDPRSILAA